jgi:hypothetical protein
MTKALAGGADDTREEGATTLVRSDWAVTWYVTRAAASGASIARTTATLPKISETETLSTVMITTLRRGTLMAVGIAAVTKIPVLPPLKLTTIAALL